MRLDRLLPELQRNQRGNSLHGRRDRVLFEKQPSLTAEVKELLHSCATQDAFAQNVPSPEWGYGKLNYPAVEKLLSAPSGK